jgi:hypothetical protein
LLVLEEQLDATIMLEHLVSLSIIPILLFAVAVHCGFTLVQIFVDPLRDVPGPGLARFSRLWYLYKIYQGDFETTNIALHEKYGPVVRIAPNEYSVNDVDGAKVIYGHGNTFVKVRYSISI